MGQDGCPPNGGFRLRMMGEGESNQQPSEGVTGDIVKQIAWADVVGRDHKFNKTGLKQGHLQHLHMSKELPTKHRDGEIPQTPSGNSTCWRASLKCLHTNAHSTENKHEQLRICVQLQGHDLVWIREMW